MYIHTFINTYEIHTYIHTYVYIYINKSLLYRYLFSDSPTISALTNHFTMSNRHTVILNPP